MRATGCFQWHGSSELLTAPKSLEDGARALYAAGCREHNRQR